MPNNIEKNILNVIKILIAFVFFTPFILGPFGINMSEYPKAVFFRSLIEIIFVLYIFLISLDKKYIPKKSILIFSLLIFYAVLIFASIAGINFYKSFFGSMQRGEGIIMHLHLLAYFVILIGIFSKKEEWLNLFKITTILSGFVSIAAILQSFHVWSLYDVDLSIRVSGTLSNPDLFANYIVLSIFLSLFLFASESKKYFKIGWMALTILNCYTLFLSATRGALAGAVVGFLFIFIICFKTLSYKKRKIILLGILVFSIVFLALFFIPSELKLQNAHITRIFGFSFFNLSGRSDIWAASWDAFRIKPILGWGAESFAFVSDKYMKTGFAGGIYFDRPHNKFLEMLGYGGILGLASYLFIFSVIFYIIFKYAKHWDGYNNRPKIIFSSILAGFFISSLVQNIFSFDNICTYMLFFLAAGFINNNFSATPEFINEEEISAPKNLPAYKMFFSMLVFVLMAFVMYQINIKPTIAAMYFPGSVGYESTDVEKAFFGYKNGISMNTIYDYDLRMAFTDRVLYLLESGQAERIKSEALASLMEDKPFLYKYISSDEEQANHLYQYIARIDEQEYIQQKNVDSLTEMETILGKAMSFNPNVPNEYQLMGDLKIFQNKYSEGESYIKKGCDMDKTDCPNDAELYKRIGAAYLKIGDIKSAIENFQKVVDLDYANKKKNSQSAILFGNPGQFIDYVAVAYARQLNDLESSKKVYARGSEVYPEYSDIFNQHLQQLIDESKSKPTK